MSAAEALAAVTLFVHTGCIDFAVEATSFEPFYRCLPAAGGVAATIANMRHTG